MTTSVLLTAFRLSVLLLFIALNAARITAAEADLILSNGKVITVDDRFSIKQAIATQAPVVLILSPLLTGGKVFSK